MNDYGFSDDVRQREPFVIKDAEGVALIAKKGRQISCMIGVSGISGVIVQSCMAEVFAAVSGFVYMHGIEITCVGDIDVGKAEDLRLHQDAAVDCVIEFDRAAGAGTGGIAVDPGDCTWVVLYEEAGEGHFGCHFIIGHTKFLCAFSVMV